MEVRATGPQIVAVARLWIGTPYVHQASVLGAGCDCLGLLRGVWRMLHGHEPETPPPYTSDWSEPSGEERLWAAARRHLLVCKRSAAEPGDVLLFRMSTGSVAKHLGIVGSAATDESFIHSYTGHGVVESPLTPPWKRRIVARFQFPEGAS